MKTKKGWTIEKRFLLTSILDSFNNQYLGLVQGVFFASYLLYLNISELKIAMLLSLVGLTQMTQLLSTWIYSKVPNKKAVILLFRFMKAVLLFLTGIIPWIFSSKYFFVALYINVLLRLVLQNISANAYIEWNDRYVAEDNKGHYYGLRNVLFNLVYIVYSFALGFMLDRFEANPYFYTLVFSLAVLFAVVDFIILKDIEFPIYNHEQLSFLKKISVPFHDKAYRKFILFSLIWMFSLNMGRPLLNVYARRYLLYDYSLIAITASVASFIKLFSGIFFGRMIDVKGSNFVIIINGIIFGLTTLLIVLANPNQPAIYIIAFISNGAVMIGFNVANFRHMIKLAKPEFMNEYLSVHGFFTGITIFLSLNISGYIIKLIGSEVFHLFAFAMNAYQLLFLLSGICHLFAIVYFFYGLKDME